MRVYSSGLVCCSVCAPAGMTADQVEAATNRENPTGVSSRWRVSEDPTFRTGEANPHPCEKADGRTHWLLTC